MTTNDNDDLWYVQMDNGDLRELTLDELDEAFNAGLIHENTFVMEVGGTEWQTLADVAGLNEEEEAPPPAPVYAPQAVGQFGRSPAPAHLAVGPARPLPNLVTHQSQYPAPTSAAMSASAWPPVVQASGYATRPTPASVVPFAGGPQSTAPVVHDLSDLDLNPPFKKRGMGVWIGAVAVVLLGGVGFAATQMKGGFSSFAQMTKDAPVAAAMTAPPAADPPPTPKAPEPAPAPEPAKEEPKAEKKEEKTEEASDKGSTKSMSEELKARLKTADESRAKERKSKRAARASKASRRSGGKKKGGGSNPFSSGGSGSDPLNGKL
jgi:hypothetical protein